MHCSFLMINTVQSKNNMFNMCDLMTVPFLFLVCRQHSKPQFLQQCSNDLVLELISTNKSMNLTKKIHKCTCFESASLYT